MSDRAKQEIAPGSQTEPNLRRTPREYHHGRTPAGWVGTTIALVGALIGTIGFLIPNTVVIIIGFVVVGISLIATVALRSMGYGQGPEQGKS